ncbi:MAG TPA: hypothetical protein VGP17_02890 [Solirubrobacteraceae bacterium]|jgi:hypothetical protein|nr:hypothetical protein [Solirubrobacteraceae bacterium]
MRERISKNSGTAALVISIISLIVASSGAADAARHAIAQAVSGARHGRSAGTPAIDGHRISNRPLPGGLLLLGANRKFPLSAIPTVKDAGEIDGKKLAEIEPSCPADTVDLGTWCLEDSPYPLTNQDIGLNNYFWAAQTCVAAGGYLPSAAQLIGAAKRVKLESTINDNRDTATVDEDPTVGLKDQREMSSTLVTVTAGSEAAGSEGVSVGSTGNPRTGEPNPVPEPANPAPATLQYVTVYSNETKGGFAGSEPVSEPQNFRCAYNKLPGGNSAEEG